MREPHLLPDRVLADTRRHFSRPFPGTERNPDEDEAYDRAVQRELDDEPRRD